MFTADEKEHKLISQNFPDILGDNLEESIKKFFNHKALWMG